MNIAHVRAKDFRSWGDLALDIPPGVQLISGPNGSGKSSTLEAIDVALFGCSTDAGRYIRRGTDQAEVSVAVETEQGVLTVIRTIKRSGTGTKISLQVWREDENLSSATVSETQAQLELALGVSRDVLHASAFSFQHTGAAFTEAKPAERKRVLMETMPSMALWPVLADDARAELKAAQSAATIARSQVEQLDGATDRLSEASERKTIAEIALDQAATAERLADENAARLAAEAEAAREARRQHAAAVESAERARGDHERATAERAAADQALARAQDAAANAPSVEDARALAHEADLQLAEVDAAYGRAVKDAQHFDTQLAEARAELADLEKEQQTGECARCGQSFAVDEERLNDWRVRATYLEGHHPGPADTAPLATARAAAQQAQSRLAEAETIQSLAGSITAAEDRARAAQDRENETAETLRAASQAVFAHGDDELAALQQAEQRHQAALAAVASGRQAHSAAAAELARAEEAARTAERQAADETAARQRLVEAEQSAAVAGILAAGFGPQGVPAMIVDGILGDLADEANRVLAELGTPIRVDLRSQKLLKSSDRLADTLDIIVTMDAMEAAYETLSGGERTRVALALRAALTRLLASKRGARVRLLVVDEPAGLDSTGCEQLAAVLEEFITAGVFDTVLLVTHQSELAEQITRVVRVEKNTSGESRLVESASPTAPKGAATAAVGGTTGVTPSPARIGAPHA